MLKNEYTVWASMSLVKNMYLVLYVTSNYMQLIGWLVRCSIVYQSRVLHSYGDATISGNELHSTRDHLAWKDFYFTKADVTQDFGFYGLNL